MDIALIETYLQKYGWKYKVIDAKSILSGFSTQSHVSFVIVIQFEEPWVRISMPSFAELPRSTDRRFEMMEKALRYNQQLHDARFGIGENGYLGISLDIFTGRGLLYEEIENSLDIVSYVAESTYPEFVD